MIYVLHHGDSDGRFGAYCLWRYAEENKELIRRGNTGPVEFKYIEVQYGKPIPLQLEEMTSDDEIFILDFSYHRDILDPFFKVVRRLVVLDHHKTGETNLAGAPYGIFDNTKSGALLAWEYFFTPITPPKVCLLVNDYDLFTKKYEDTAALEAWLQYEHIGQNWERWHNLTEKQSCLDAALRLGTALHNQNCRIVKSFVKNPENYMIRKGFLIHDWHSAIASYAIYNGNTILRNEIAEAFYTQFDIDVTIQWRVRGDLVLFTIRSPNGKHFSAEEYAVQHGGGGHDTAAAFTMPLNAGLIYVQMLMQVSPQL